MLFVGSLTLTICAVVSDLHSSSSSAVVRVLQEWPSQGNHPLAGDQSVHTGNQRGERYCLFQLLVPKAARFFGDRGCPVCPRAVGARRPVTWSDTGEAGEGADCDPSVSGAGFY